MALKQLFAASLLAVFSIATAQEQASAADESVEFLATMGCMIEPSMRIEISSPVPGVIDRMPVKLGDPVRKGGVLLSLKSGVEQASVELAQVRYEFASRQVERNDEMYEEELISIHERDEFNTEALVAEKELTHARQVLDLRTVRSPINGVVVDRFRDPGEFVENDTIVVLAALDPLKVHLVMPYDSFGSIPEKGQLRVFPDEPVGGEYGAKITLVDPIIDAASGTFRVQAELSNPSNQLPAGMQCRAALQAN